MKRYVCIHGHFYQPPRENPWLDAVETENSAYPYHDWNERITAECYQANAVSRILDDRNRIVRIVNNYERISFNFGPTLLRWLEIRAPETYRTIIESDRRSRTTYSGHGSAMAQPYNHMILPLANRRDKTTQVLWGIRDFEYRFGRSPEGMWLPETAVDLETLNVLAEHGIRFTILAPHQAARVRHIGDNAWHDVTAETVDTTMPYWVRLASGRSMVLYFYHGAVARAVAFERVLANGRCFADCLKDAFIDRGSGSQLLHIACDGETYGHHHLDGDIALACALERVESEGLARITNYGEYLEKHPPNHEVEIRELTSWSCTHGIDRWRSDCGCNTGGHPQWRQTWRGPLRDAVDWLRDQIVSRYERASKDLMHDPWEARNDYISVVLDRSPQNVGRFLEQHAVHRLRDVDRTKALKLLELQRHAMLMFTSCGWFFDDLAGIETIMILQHAARVIQIAERLFSQDIESQFLNILGRAESNVPAWADGRHVYEKLVKPAIVDMPRAGTHYAVSSLFQEYPDSGNVYCYSADSLDRRDLRAGDARLLIGRIRIVSCMTWESALLSYAVLYLGGRNLTGGVHERQTDRSYELLAQEVSECFGRSDIAEVTRILNREFCASDHAIRCLFRDEQRKILGRILDSGSAEAVYRQLYQHHAPMLQYLSELDVPYPAVFRTAAELILNTDLRRALEDNHPDADLVRQLVQEAESLRIPLDSTGLAYAFQKTVRQQAEQFAACPRDFSVLLRFEDVVDLARLLPFRVNLREAQNTFLQQMESVYAKFPEQRREDAENARAWATHFLSLGEKLSLRVELGFQL